MIISEYISSNAILKVVEHIDLNQSIIFFNEVSKSFYISKVLIHFYDFKIPQVIYVLASRDSIL